jgi:hypothetical protein
VSLYYSPWLQTASCVSLYALLKIITWLCIVTAVSSPALYQHFDSQKSTPPGACRRGARLSICTGMASSYAATAPASLSRVASWPDWDRLWRSELPPMCFCLM